jgi:hypothetical protein
MRVACTFAAREQEAGVANHGQFPKGGGKELSAERHERRYIDRAGVAWRAWERRRTEQPPALVFESRNAIRLVRDYPDNWHTLPTPALEALSWCV